MKDLTIANLPPPTLDRSNLIGLGELQEAQLKVKLEAYAKPKIKKDGLTKSQYLVHVEKKLTELKLELSDDTIRLFSDSHYNEITTQLKCQEVKSGEIMEGRVMGNLSRLQKTFIEGPSTKTASSFQQELELLHKQDIYRQVLKDSAGVYDVYFNAVNLLFLNKFHYLRNEKCFVDINDNTEHTSQEMINLIKRYGLTGARAGTLGHRNELVGHILGNIQEKNALQGYIFQPPKGGEWDRRFNAVKRGDIVIVEGCSYLNQFPEIDRIPLTKTDPDEDKFIYIQGQEKGKPINRYLQCLDTSEIPENVITRSELTYFQRDLQSVFLWAANNEIEPAWDAYNMLMHCLARPGEKCLKSMHIVGEQGVGKTSLIQLLFMYAFSGYGSDRPDIPNRLRPVKSTKGAALDKSFDALFLNTVLLLVEELSSVTKKGISNMRSRTTAPESGVELKGKDEVQAKQLARVISDSNEYDAMPVDGKNRRTIFLSPSDSADQDHVFSWLEPGVSWGDSVIKSYFGKSVFYLHIKDDRVRGQKIGSLLLHLAEDLDHQWDNEGKGKFPYGIGGALNPVTGKMWGPRADAIQSSFADRHRDDHSNTKERLTVQMVKAIIHRDPDWQTYWNDELPAISKDNLGKMLRVKLRDKHNKDILVDDQEVIRVYEKEMGRKISDKGMVKRCRQTGLNAIDRGTLGFSNNSSKVRLMPLFKSHLVAWDNSKNLKDFFTRAKEQNMLNSDLGEPEDDWK